MPITTASNGIRPQYRALDIIKLNVPVTPGEINEYVGTGDYAAKYVSFLRRDGFVFATTRSGRSIVSYELIAEPTNAAQFRNQTGKNKIAKAPVSKVAKPVKKNYSNLVADAPVKKLLKDIGLDLNSGAKENGELGNFAIDRDFDSYDGDLTDLILDY